MHNKEIWFGFVNSGVVKITTNKTTSFTSPDPTPPYGRAPVNIYVLRLVNGRCLYTSLMAQKLPPVIDSQIISFNTYHVSFDFSGTNFNLISFNDKSILIGKENYLNFVDSDGNTHQYVLPVSNPILKLAKATDGKIWMLQRNNTSYLVEFKNNGLTFIDSITFAHNATGLVTDLQGDQWISTLDQGIYMVPNPRIRIFSLLKESNSHKLSCLNSNLKDLYVGLSEGKLLKIDRRFDATIYYSAGRNKWPASIGSINFNRDGEPQLNFDPLFIWGSGLNSYHTKILQFNEEFFLVGASNGLALLSKNRQMAFNSHENGFSKRVTEICRLSPQIFLVGTLNGLYYFESGKGYTLRQEPSLKDLRITAAKALSNQLFGIATRGSGIFISIRNKFYSVNQKAGLISDLAEDLYFENDSVLWEATFKGISKIYFKLHGDSLVTRIKNYTKDDGLCSNQVNGIMGFNGFIWLATNEGLCYFRPQDLSEVTTMLPLYFGNISVNGIKHSTDSLVLTHDENNIYIEFNALYYKAIQGIRYRVRLKSIGPWKYTDLNFIQYFSLPPGEYQFEVAADDKDGKYKSDVHVLKFTIKPRFVDTALFKVLIALALFFIIMLVGYTFFSYQKLKSTNIIKLLQSEFKALSYQINPHFIFNVLNSIQYYILKKDTDNAVHLLGSFALLIRRIVNNSRQQYIGIIEEVECLKEYMDLEKMRLDNKFEYTINIDSSIDIEDKNILPMIMQPLVENSIWHGIVPSSKPGIISIDFRKEKGAVICKVEDNGVGINTSINKEKSQNNLSLAMKNVSERLKIISELNDSTWAIKTEDKSVRDPSQSGTIVTIVFPALKERT
jgi:hypothetical protein